MINSSDAIMSELEQSPEDRLSLHQNRSTTLQGQIDLVKSHQVLQDLKINYALAREAEEADGRLNDRFVYFLFSCFCVPFWFIRSVFSLFSLFLFLVSFRNLNLIILRKVGKIGGDESKVRARVGHILACISKDIDFSVADVKVSTFCLFLCLFRRLISCASSLD